MTPLQMIAAASQVRVMVELAAGGSPVIYITKTEARRMVREYGLSDDEIGSVHLNASGVCSIILAT